MLIFAFWGAVFVVFFAYFGYPLTLAIIARKKERRVNKAPILPTATLIITAYNEEARIREKLENTTTLDYPREKLQIIIASDGSTDKTNNVVEEYADQGVELLEVVARGGKENAQREAVQHAHGEVLVFSDVATRLDPDGLRKIVANFADPDVGCVSSVDRIIGKDGKPGGEGAYVRYEMWLRQIESRVHSLVGLSGSFFAARREVCQDFSADMQSDFRTLLNSMRLGLRGVSDPETIGYYLDVADNQREFDRKVRTVLRGLTVFFRNLEFLNSFQYGIFSYQYFCHKLLRWLVPLFLLIAFAANLLLAFGSGSYALLLLAQLAFYGVAYVGWKSNSDRTSVLLKIPTYFAAVNVAIAMAWWQYLKGKRMVMWTPSER